MGFNPTFTEIPLSELRAVRDRKKAAGYRCTQILCVNTDEAVDMIYTFQKDENQENYRINGVTKEDVVPSVTNCFVSAFPYENEAVELFGVNIEGIAIDFSGHFYDLAQQEPMTIITPEKLAAREKAAKIAKAKAAAAAKAAAKAAAEKGDAPKAAPKPAAALITEADIEEKVKGLDPEKAAKVRAAMEAKMARQKAQAADQAKEAEESAQKAAEEKAAATAAADAALEEKLKTMDPEKAAKVRAAMEAKAKREAAAQAKEEGEE